MKKISKRQRFIASSLAIWGLIIAYTNIASLQTLPVVILIALITYIICIIAIYEEIRGVEFATLFIIPVLYTLGTISFIDILPDRKVYRYPFIIGFPVGMYMILLTQNIFNVAAIRTIQLLRAAKTVSYFTTLITAFLLIAVTTVNITNPFYYLISIFILISVLTFQFFWSFDLGPKVEKRVVLYTAMTSLLLPQASLILIFIPVSPALKSLLLITYFYVILGISTHHLERKISLRIVSEYIFFAFSVSIVILVSTKWAG